ncbi:hypothetical protein ACWCOT_39790 [Nonomuraea bangladeshensis]
MKSDPAIVLSASGCSWIPTPDGITGRRWTRLQEICRPEVPARGRDGHLILIVGHDHSLPRVRNQEAVPISVSVTTASGRSRPSGAVTPSMVEA